MCLCWVARAGAVLRKAVGTLAAGAQRMLPSAPHPRHHPWADQRLRVEG